MCNGVGVIIKNNVTTSIVARHALAIFLLSCIIIILSAPVWAASDTSAFVHQSAVQQLTGKVEYQKLGTGPWRPVSVGTKLSMEDRVRTGADASCRILVGDVAAIELGAQSEGRLGSLRQVREQAEVRDVIVFHLERGTSRQSFTRRAGRIGQFQVATPVAVAGVRGTSFEMALDDLIRNLSCACLEGTVNLTGSAGGKSWSRDVTAGTAIQVSVDKTPAEAAAAAPAVLQRIWSIQSAAQQETTLPIMPELKPGDVPLEIAPADISLSTAGGLDKTFEGRTITITGAAAPKTITISFGGATIDHDVTLDVGKDFSFTRSFEAYPLVIEASGNVSTSGGKTIIKFGKLKVAYVEEAAKDVYKIPCAVTASPGGVGSMTIIVSPGDEVEVE